MSSVVLKGVRKTYNKLETIKGVDLAIEPGEFVVFVGPSGCGKSTLLRMVAGLEEASAGDILIDGQRVNEVDPSRRGIAMVFQNYALYPHMTVRQNMGFALRFGGIRAPEIKRRVEEAARILELTALLDRRPGALSGGQRQRVAIGRAIVRDPKVFLFDEPLSNLDAELRINMRIEIARLHNTLKSTMVYVTHDQTEAMTLADRIVVLRNGMVEQVGTPLELYDDPSSQFVAGFIGSPKMNFLSGSLRGGVVRLAAIESMAFSPALSTLPADQEVSVGIRPQIFRGATGQQIPVFVDLVEHLGDETYAYVRLPNGNPLTIATGNERQLRSGDQIQVTLPNAGLLLFDAAGQRIR